ncbi:MAG: NAD(P)H-dependent oxidoreductase subunit E [Acidobacteria bacterium]|nr:NAD(P)H-dependent oxidoreductase subunit E [Acidobacteriota bacterium]
MKQGSNGHSTLQWRQKIAGKFEPLPQYLIPVLQFVQTEAGYLPPEAMTATAEYLRVSESKVYGVASFYAQFHFEPRGRHIITVCRGTACHVRGSAAILKDVEKKLGIPAGGTTPDMNFSIETVACFGSCALAPVVVADTTVHGRQSSSSTSRIVDRLASETPELEPKKNPAKRAKRTKAAASAAGGKKILKPKKH